MRLPEMRYGDGLTKSTQVRFGGYDHRPGAGDGTLWDMKNLTGDQFPLLAVRRPRRLDRELKQPGGLWAHNALCWADGDGFFCDGKRVGTVIPGRKQFAGMGSRILIWPDKAVYDTVTGRFERLEVSASLTGVSFRNGTLYGEEAERNTLYCAGVDFRELFSAGDAVTVSGCTRHPENNKTPIIREIDGDGHALRFYENVFELDTGADEKPRDYTEPGTVTVARTLPEMDFICVNDNRLWGCKGDSIYCSKLGDPKNFNVFDGLGTDSFQVDAGSAGEFTACVSFLGYPCFFKTDRIYKMYGDLPSNFQLMGSATLGVAPGSHGSLAVAGETLFYLSPAGVVSYSGGIPSPIGACFGEQRFSEGVAGSDGLKYYISMRDEGTDRARPQGSGRYQLFVYDSQRGVWHREDETRAAGWACLDGTLYLLAEDGGLWQVNGNVSGSDTLEGPLGVPAQAQRSREAPQGGAFSAKPAEGRPTGLRGEEESQRSEMEFSLVDGNGMERISALRWYAEFNDFTEGSPDARGYGKIQLRLELEAGSQAWVELKYDSEDGWRRVSPVLTATRKRTFLLPVIPRRADHFRLRLGGTGWCAVYSIAREFYGGSENRTVRL